jgi:tRNA 2-thiouridine synthesizing protein E
MSIVDDEGFLVDFNSWNEEIAKKMAESQFTIQLKEKHWACIGIVREYYKKWGSMPMVKTIRDEAKVTVEEFDDLFRREKSSARGVLCKISGLPRLLCIAAGC